MWRRSVAGNEERTDALDDLLAQAARASDEFLGLPSAAPPEDAGAPSWWHGEEEAGQEALAMLGGARRSAPG